MSKKFALPASSTRSVLTSVLITLALLVAVPGAADAAVRVGYQGPSWAGADRPPTQAKTQSKLWYNDGSWWGALYQSGAGWRVHRWDRPTATWVANGPVFDSRYEALTDTLWVGGKLYIASHIGTDTSDSAQKPSLSNKPANLHRFSYSDGVYSLDAGFPTQIGDYSSDSLTIDRDSTGRLWAAWTQVSNPGTGWQSTIWINNSTVDGTSWGTPRLLPTPDAVATSDDISAIVAFRNSIGVMWSDQAAGALRFATHPDSAAPDTGWTTRNALAGTKLVDDHINLKSLQYDDSGHVVAVSKTSLNEISGSSARAQLMMHVYKVDTATFSSVPVATIADCVSRPQVVVDPTAKRAYVAYTAPSSWVNGCPYSGVSGSIYVKSSPLDNPSFPAGRGTLLMEDASSANLNDVTTTKQPVSAATGMLWLASHRSQDRYWTADVSDLTPPAQAAFVTSVSSGVAPLAVTFTDTSTGSVQSRQWNFGDGTTSTQTNPQHTFSQPGTYQVSLTITTASGPSTATRTITVTPPTNTSGAITAVGSSTAANGGTNTITLDAVTGAAPGDLLVASVVVRGTTTVTAPAGWTQVEDTLQGTTQRLVTYVRPVTSGSHTFTLNKAQPASATLVAYRGVNLAQPVASSAAQLNSSSTSFTAPSVNGQDGQLLLSVVATPSQTTITPPTGMTERAESTTGPTAYKATLEVADRSLYAGPSGTSVATAANAGVSIGQSLALTPADAAPPKAPQAAFTSSATTGLAPLPVTFTDASIGLVASRQWNFGDGTTSTLADPQHTFSTPGTYQVSLTVSNASGSDTTTQTITVTAPTQPSGAISAVGSSTAANGSAASITVDAVADAEPTDLLVASVVVRGTPTVTAPAGWTRVQDSLQSSTQRLVTFVRPADGVGTTTFTLNKVQPAAVSVVAYRGVNLSAPVATSAAQLNDGSSKSLTAPSVTGQNGQMLVAVVATSTLTTVTPSAGMTERAEQTTGPTTYKATLEVADRTLTSAGESGTSVATATAAGLSVGHTLALVPAS